MKLPRNHTPAATFAPGPAGSNRDQSAKRKSDGFHWFPFYFAEHYTTTSHLSADAHSAYVRLLCVYGIRQGPFPDNDSQLAKIAGISSRKWSRIRPDVSALFQVDVVKKEWRHTELDAAIARAKDLSAKRADAGRKGGGAAARRPKDPSATDVAIARFPAKQLPQHPEPEPEPEPESYSAGARTGPHDDCAQQGAERPRRTIRGGAS